jgi:hypothetical protein
MRTSALLLPLFLVAWPRERLPVQPETVSRTCITTQAPDTSNNARRRLSPGERRPAQMQGGESRPQCPMPVVRPMRQFSPASVSPIPPPRIPTPFRTDTTDSVRYDPAMPIARSGCWNPLDPGGQRGPIDSIRPR